MPELVLVFRRRWGVSQASFSAAASLLLPPLLLLQHFDAGFPLKALERLSDLQTESLGDCRVVGLEDVGVAHGHLLSLREDDDVGESATVRVVGRASHYRVHGQAFEAVQRVGVDQFDSQVGHLHRHLAVRIVVGKPWQGI